MTKDKALKIAIEALEQYIGVVQHKFNAENWGDIEDGGKPAIKAIHACKEALEQPNMTYEDGFAHGYEAHRAEQALKEKTHEI